MQKLIFRFMYIVLELLTEIYRDIKSINRDDYGSEYDRAIHLMNDINRESDYKITIES